jgi:hypothetical protein
MGTMSKLHIPLALDVGSSGTRPRWLSIGLAVVVIAVLVPLAVESMLCCYAQWCEAFGRPVEVWTPAFDAIAGCLRGGREWYADHVAPSVLRVLHEPKVALPFSTALVLLAIALMRR